MYINASSSSCCWRVRFVYLHHIWRINKIVPLPKWRGDVRLMFGLFLLLLKFWSCRFTSFSLGLFGRVHRCQRPARSRRRKGPQKAQGNSVLHSKFNSTLHSLSSRFVPRVRNHAHPFSSSPFQVFPDQPEKRRAAQIFKTAIDQVNCTSKHCILPVASWVTKWWVGFLLALLLDRGYINRFIGWSAHRACRYLLQIDKNYPWFRFFWWQRR